MWLANSLFRRSLRRANDRKGDKYGSMDTFDMYMHMFSLCLPPHHHQQWNPQRWARHRRRRAHLCGGGRRPPPLCLATTEVSSCHNRHLASPQRTTFLAAPDIRRGKRGCKLPMFFGHNSTLVAPFEASMGAK